MQSLLFFVNRILIRFENLQSELVIVVKNNDFCYNIYASIEIHLSWIRGLWLYELSENLEIRSI